MKSNLRQNGALILLLLFAGCEGGGVTAPEPRPSAFFQVSVQETSNGFIVSFLNQSRNSDGIPATGGASNLDFNWRFQDKGASSAVTPSNRTWTRLELGLVDEGDSAERLIELSVIEDNDVAKRDDHSETLVFIQSAVAAAP